MPAARRFHSIWLLPLAIGLIVFLVLRENRFSEQHAAGHPTTGVTADAAAQSQTTLRIGSIFVTYISADQNSALWIARPAETLSSYLWPPKIQPFDYQTAIRWNDAGRVVWSNTGPSSADLLIEFAPKSNHRLAVIRVTCANGNCQTTSQERGMAPETSLWIGDDGSSLIAGSDELKWYESIAGLVNGTGEYTVPRTVPRAEGEVGAPSKDVTLMLTPQGEGDWLGDKTHATVQLELPENAQLVAMRIAEGVLFVLREAQGATLWDCPMALLKGSAECTAYHSPAGFHLGARVLLQNTECGIVIGSDGWTWIVRRNAGSQDLIQAEGVTACFEGEILAVRQNDLNYLTPKRAALDRNPVPVQFKARALP